MADNTQETEGTTQTAAAEQSGSERTFTQEDVNRLVGEARQKERRKYEGYVDGKGLEEAQQRATKAEEELAQLKADAERQQAIAKVADSANVPTEVVAMLTGKDADELEGQVRRLLKLLPAYPTRTDDGGAKAAAKKSTAQQFGDILDKMLGQ